MPFSDPRPSRPIRPTPMSLYSVKMLPNLNNAMNKIQTWIRKFRNLGQNLISTWIKKYVCEKLKTTEQSATTFHDIFSHKILYTLRVYLSGHTIQVQPFTLKTLI